MNALLFTLALVPGQADDAAIRKAATFYASFDEAPRGDFGGGSKTLSTRFGSPGKGPYKFEKGYNADVFKIAKGKGIHGGALQPADVLPNGGRVFFPAKGNIAYKKGGWGGSVSFWCNIDPNVQLKTQFCDPVQITHKGAHNGAIWFDFNDAKPRDSRMGAFPAVPEGQKPVGEGDPKAPLVRIKDIGWKDGDWHHVVITWQNFDTGKPDAVATLYIDGKRIGEVKDQAIAMDWDIDQVGIYVAISYTGLLDEFAVFNRPLSAAEVERLHKEPGLLAPLKKAAGPALPRVEELARRRLAPSDSPPVAPRFPFDAVSAERYQRDYAAWLGLPLDVQNDIGMTFVLVPPGTFVMGSPADEPGHGSGGYDETLHQVTLTRPLYLSKYETTVGQFRRFVEAEKFTTDGEKTGGGNAHDDRAVWKHRPGTSWLKPGYAGPFSMEDQHPVVHASFTDSKAFCAWLNRGLGGTGWSYDLPTEAQWEWACRAGSGSRYWWGPDEDTTGTVANVGDGTLKRIHPEWPRTIMPMDDGHAFPAPVGSYRANAFGLHDMLGNVWEFCSTRYGPYPKEPTTDPGDLDPKRGFAVRGGGWSNIATDARSASRNADPPHFCHSNLGFRVALYLPRG
jgi:formylglycine-generating enzyme required for sulfatase activity